MNKETAAALRKSTIYSVYLRNHTGEGTFRAFETDLDRLRDLGTDIIWFMPIHPIGEENRKGVLGSPYAIRDFRAINPEYGTLEDFQHVVEEIHKRGMKVIIDVVFNHTSPDSVLRNEHPEFFYKKPDGRFGNRVGEWSDIIDLDYGNRELWKEQIETLVFWTNKGIDGFRCDVAQLVPMEFWAEARAACAESNPQMIWLSESVGPDFREELVKEGVPCHTDEETYQVFDILYDYDLYPLWKDCVAGKMPMEIYFTGLEEQWKKEEGRGIRLRFLENHDLPRAASLFPRDEWLANWTAFTFLTPGASLLFTGQETGTPELPSLFDKDPVDWSVLGSKADLSPLLKSLTVVRGREELAAYEFSMDFWSVPGAVLVRWDRPDHYSGPGTSRSLLGLFNFEGRKRSFPLHESGSAVNLLTGETYELNGRRFPLEAGPVVLAV